MQHDFLDLDEFVEEASKTDRDKVREQPILPFQLEGLQMGTWALHLGGLSEGRNPLSWTVAVLYIYAKQDYIALAAMQGGDVDELIAEAEAAYADGIRRGRAYDPDNLSGALSEYQANVLIPISEEQAQEIQFYDFKLPLIFGMCDWFEPLIEQVINGFTEGGVDGMTVIVCPQCGDQTSVRMVTSFTANGAFKPLKTETGYALLKAEGFTVTGTQHAHLMCGNESCDYDECVDLNEFEVDDSRV
jgi:hypothetical protein